MLDRRSALSLARPYASPVLQIGEARGFSLLQVAGPAKAISPITGMLPAKVGTVLQADGRTLMRTGENQFWIIGPENDGIAAKLNGIAILTPLSHSRTRIVIEGAPTRDVLGKSIPLDFHPTVFKPGMFAMILQGQNHAGRDHQAQERVRQKQPCHRQRKNPYWRLALRVAYSLPHFLHPWRSGD